MEQHCDELSTTRDVAGRRPAFAILPVGAHEQHGDHLPLATDSVVATAIARQVASETGGLLLPVIPYGTSTEHRGFAGTISVRWSTLAALVTDVVTACWEQRINLVFVLSGHGGNFILNPCIRELNATTPAGRRAVLIPEHITHPRRELEEPATDLHAGRRETSLMLALQPEAVHLDLANDMVPQVSRAELTNEPLSALSPTGVWGEPTKATAEDGKQMLDEIVDHVRRYITNCLKSAADEPVSAE